MLEHSLGVKNETFECIDLCPTILGIFLLSHYYFLILTTCVQTPGYCDNQLLYSLLYV